MRCCCTKQYIWQCIFFTTKGLIQYLVIYIFTITGHFPILFLSLPSACGRAKLLRTQIGITQMEVIYRFCSDLPNKCFSLLLGVLGRMFLTNLLANIFWRIFFDEFFLTNYFEEFFEEFFDDFFDEFFWWLFWRMFEVFLTNFWFFLDEFFWPIIF